MTEAIFTPEQLAEIRDYHRVHYLWGAIGPFVNFGLAVLILRFVVRPLYARCERVKLPSRVLSRMWNGDGWAAALTFSFAYCAITAALYLPLDIYFDYVHEHAFGMSKHTPVTWATDFAKEFLLGTAAYGALTFGLFGLARRLPRWWLVLGTVGAVVLLFSAAADPYRARVFFDQKPLPEGALRDRISALMAKAQIDFKDVLVEDNSRATVRLQAYFAGKGPTRTIVLNQSLLQNLTHDEVLAAVAHEAGHVNEWRWPGTIASALTLIAFLFGVDRLMRLAARRGWWGMTEPADIRVLPLVFVVFSLATTFVKPVAGAVSRARETSADVYGLELTQNADAFSMMLVKAARVNKMDPDPPRWVVWKGRSHPSIRERLETVEAWKKTNGG